MLDVEIIHVYHKLLYHGFHFFFDKHSQHETTDYTRVTVEL